MPLTKTSVIFIVIVLLLVSIFSGCILDDIFGGTSFSLSSSPIIDDEGFPALSISYTCSDAVTVKLYAPGSKLVDSDYFLKGSDTAGMYLGAYMETISAGRYSLKAYDSSNTAIFTKSYSFSGSDVSILSCDQKWWSNMDTTMLIGLSMNVRNYGDVPVYPYQVIVNLDSEEISGLVLPSVILPGESESIDCSIYKNGAPSDSELTVSLLDTNGNVLNSNSYAVDISSTVPTRTFTKGVESTLKVPYPEFLYDYYSSLERTQHEDYGIYVFDPYDDVYIDIFVDCLISTLPFGELNFDKKNDVDKISVISSFTQNLDYIKDSPTNDSLEYPNYPIETLFKNKYGGDCEDKAILTVSLLDHMEFNTALFRLPNHMAVGIQLSESAVPNYDHYHREGYYYLETTTAGKPVGFIPNEYKSPSELTIYPISSRPLLIHNWEGGSITIYTNTEMGDFVKVITIIENKGKTTANNIIIKGVFTTSYDFEEKSEQETISSLEPGMKKKVILSVDIPKYSTTWFKTLIYLDGEVVDEKESASSFP